jgi:cytochrome c oxidase accessory protein FixG
MSHTPVYKPQRDVVTTIRDDGSRRFLYPADAPGRNLNARRIVALLLIGFYLLAPWVKVGGFPAIFLDVANRRFHLFGLTLAAQDLWLLFFLITGLGFSLFFITSLFGRIWCGWYCPQTVYLDHVYRRIERWIDGDPVQRRALADAPLTGGKIFKRGLKHGLYILVSLGITHLFLSYFVSIPKVWYMMQSAPTQNWSSFVFIAVATGIIYFNFAWFREQLCIVICPYGRLQSVLSDDNTRNIGYDSRRGEPRGKVGTSGAGDCIDCERCVKVCPTGIDIRHGLQLECIACAACIDACDDVMTKVGRKPGLIRYDSLNAFTGKATKWLRPRTIIYFVLLCLGASVATWAFSGVKPAFMGATRMIGAPYYVDGTTVRNQFLVRIVNKRNAPMDLVLTAKDLPPDAQVHGIESKVHMKPLGEEIRPIIVAQPRSSFTGGYTFVVQASDEDETFHIARSMEFLGPEPAAGQHGAAPGEQ